MVQKKNLLKYTRLTIPKKELHILNTGLQKLIDHHRAELRLLCVYVED
jgi:hypothetical protein